ncbi:hypothetical protein TNCV_3682801 [Trichonephila clavipes]|uniref:Uncharacterized protein n=1 Tax=Trichonephila clavipes TaxID=2585209 RepID=A0A8X6V3D3_TRICX|nr:hypothetical protein TNCV_3682801 [Trichonephila clavipes]
MHALAFRKSITREAKLLALVGIERLPGEYGIDEFKMDLLNFMKDFKSIPSLTSEIPTMLSGRPCNIEQPHHEP